MAKTDGSLTFSVNVDNSKAAKELNKVEQKIKELENEYNRLASERDAQVQSARQQELVLDKELALLNEMRAATKGTFETAEIAEQAERVRGLRAEYNATERSVERISNAMGKTERKIGKAKTRAGELTEEITMSRSATARLKDATAEADKRMEKFVNHVKNLAKRVFVFSLITSSIRSMRDWFDKVIKSNKDASAEIAKLKGALLTLIQPLGNTIIPLFTRLVNVLIYGVTALSRVMASLFGTTIEESANAAENLYNEQQALDGVGSAAKDASKQLAGFDKINKLTGETNTTSTTIVPEFKVSELPDWLENWVSKIEATIEDIRFKITDGAISDGAADWEDFLPSVLGAVIGGMFGGLKGSIIGLAVGGMISLLSLKFREKTDKTESSEQLEKVIELAIEAIVGGIVGWKLFGIKGGVIGLLSGALISLISMEFKEGDASTWDEKDTLNVALGSILGAILGGVFGGLHGAAIGMLLGATISFAAIEFSEGDYNKDAATASLRIAIFAVLGVVVGTMLGGFIGGVLGLIVGLTIGFSTVAFDKKIDESVRSVAKAGLGTALTGLVGAIVGAALLGPIGFVVGGLIGLTLGAVLTIAFKDVLFGNTEETVKKTEKYLKKYSSVIAPYEKYADIGLKYSGYSVPQLATGTVVPPNREFLAVLGDNKKETEIVSPMSTMKQAFLEAMRESGGTGGTQTIVIKPAAGLTRYLKYELDEENLRQGTSVVGVTG